MKTTLSLESINIIKSTAELVTSNDTKITKRMYEILFSKYPHVKKIFANAPEDQYMRLAEIISAYAVNIDKIERLKPALQVIAKIHVSSEIKSGHYPMIGMVLMQAMEETLGERASVAFMDAWREAYQVISKILIEMEKGLYQSREGVLV